MANIFIVLAYVVAVLTLIYGLVYLLINTVNIFKKHAAASADLYNDIKLGFYTTLVILFISWFLGQGLNFEKEIMLMSNSLKNFGLIWFSYSCLCALGLLANSMLTDDKSCSTYTESRMNLKQIMKTTGFWSIIILVLAWLFSY